jgi:RNA polymerase sigma factor (sigma-70 family)
VITSSVVDQIYRPLRARAYELTRSDAAADDLTHETLLQLLERPPRWEGSVTQTLHYARLRMRTLFLRNYVSQQVVVGNLAGLAVHGRIDGGGYQLEAGTNHEERLLARLRKVVAKPIDQETRRRVTIERWPASEQGKVWKLRHVDRLTLAEIAARTGKALGTVKATLHQAERARQRLGLVSSTHGVLVVEGVTRRDG